MTGMESNGQHADGMLGRQWKPPTMDMRSPEYAAYHREHFAPVRDAQRVSALTPARSSLAEARKSRLSGDRAGAARSLTRAGQDRDLAARVRKTIIPPTRR